jgi:hypothetical protein
MNTINVHDIHSSEEFPTFVGHDNNNISNVQVVCHMEPKNPLATNVEVVHEDACHQNALGKLVKIEAYVEATLPYFIHMGICLNE